MDEVIFEEFKGTGNIQWTCRRRLAERRVFPAIDIKKSGTRHEELLLSEEELRKVWLMRRALDLLGDGQDPTEAVLERMRRSKTNQEFLDSLGKEGALRRHCSLSRPRPRPPWEVECCLCIQES